jgi:hypothetical protein
MAMTNILTWQMFTTRRRSLPRQFPVSALPFPPAMRNLKVSNKKLAPVEKKETFEEFC